MISEAPTVSELLLARIIRLGYKLAESTLVIIPCIIGVLLLIRPCQLPFLGSLILPTCHVNLNDEVLTIISIIIIRVLLAAVESILNLCIILISFFYGIYILLSGIIYLMEESVLIFRKINFTTDYRKLQVLGALLNSCVRNRIFATVAFVNRSNYASCDILHCFETFRFDEHGTFCVCCNYNGGYDDCVLYLFRNGLWKEQSLVDGGQEERGEEWL